ncbi:MAG: DUF3147 family protein [Alphaproteobacteria bacterium]|nr:DUF3147 family protein [Alphaproteobacteria bacterium]
MMENILRVFITSIIIFALTEIAKRFSFLAAIVASSPIATIATCFWLHSENQSVEKISTFAWQTTLLLPPSLIFFIGFPLALKRGMSFWLAMPLFVGSMIIAYSLYIFILRKCGFKFV